MASAARFLMRQPSSKTWSQDESNGDSASPAHAVGCGSFVVPPPDDTDRKRGERFRHGHITPHKVVPPPDDTDRNGTGGHGHITPHKVVCHPEEARRRIRNPGRFYGSPLLGSSSASSSSSSSSATPARS